MSKPYKLHKVNSLPSTATEGDIYFVKSDKKIYVRTASGWEDFNGVPVNNLTTTTTGKALDAAQGYALKQALDTGLNDKVKYGDIILSTNPFIQQSSLYISKIDNSWYCLDRRHTVKATLYDTEGNSSEVNPYSLFDGNYETNIIIPKDNTLKIHITFNGAESSTYNGVKVYPGYPYGEILLSFYYTGCPKSVTGRVYCNWEAQGVGWKDLNFKTGVKEPNHITKYGYNLYSVYQNYYAISELEITIVGDDPAAHLNYETRPSQLELKSVRPHPRLTPFVSKYGEEKLFYKLDAPSFSENGVRLDNKYALKTAIPSLTDYQKKEDSTLSTSSKTIVGAINELKIEAGMRDNDISAAQSQALSAQEEATDAKNKVTDLEKKIPTIDSALSDTSTNPVQNKILKTCLDNIADNVDATADAVATLSNKETTIAGQKVKIGGEITAVQLTKGLRFPIRSVLNLLESDQSLSLSSFNAYLTENNLSLQDYFCAPTMIYRSEDDAEPKCGMMYNSPTSHCLTGIFDTGTDTVEFEDIQKIQFNTNSGTINIGNNGLAEVPSATINLSSVPTTSTPVTTTLNDYDYKQMTDLSIKKYVKFPNTMSVNNARTLMELTLMEKSEMIRLSGAEEVWTYVYQHICYYGGGIHVFEFSLNSDTKVLTAKMIM